MPGQLNQKLMFVRHIVKATFSPNLSNLSFLFQVFVLTLCHAVEPGRIFCIIYHFSSTFVHSFSIVHFLPYFLPNQQHFHYSWYQHRPAKTHTHFYFLIVTLIIRWWKRNIPLLLAIWIWSEGWFDLISRYQRERCCLPPWWCFRTWVRDREGKGQISK